MDIPSLLVRLSQTYALSGRVSSLDGQACLLQLARKYCKDVYLDALGNIVCHIQGSSRRKILVMTYYDEAGFLVRDIDDEGFIRLSKVGDITEGMLSGCELVIHGKEKIFGVLGAKPPHLMAPADKEKPLTLQEALVDTGHTQQDLMHIVTVGDGASLRCNFTPFMNGGFSGARMITKSLVICLLQAMKNIKKDTLEDSLYFVFATGQGTQHAGAFHAIQEIKPQRLLWIGEDAFSNPSGAAHGGQADVRKGAAIVKSPILTPHFTAAIQKTAALHAIEHQIIVRSAENMQFPKLAQLHGEGMEVALLTLPANYRGGPQECVYEKDIQAVSTLISVLLSRETAYKA